MRIFKVLLITLPLSLFCIPAPANPMESREILSVFGSFRPISGSLGIPKAASAQTLASRAFVTTTTTVYGGFQLAVSANVYLLVRGNSLGTLGVTQAYLDAPRVRLYNSRGEDLIIDGTGRPGFSACSAGQPLEKPVADYYLFVRGQPAHSRDTCIAGRFSAGSYTFSITPSIPGVTTTSIQSDFPAGEALFEVILGP
jgi:hypothetical protein